MKHFIFQCTGENNIYHIHSLFKNLNFNYITNLNKIEFYNIPMNIKT